MRRLFGTLILVAALSSVFTGSAAAGIALERFDVTFNGPQGEVDWEAGSHPFSMTTSLEVSSETNAKGTFPTEATKDVLLGQIPGFVGDPAAVPQCSSVDFLARVPGKNDLPQCADSSAIGVANVIVGSALGKSTFTVPLYSLSPSFGSVARLGFLVQSVPVTVEVGVGEEPPYRVVASATQVTQVLEFFGAELTIWGVPADPRHDKERGACRSASSPQEDECPAEVAEKPFLTLPRACTGPLATTYQLDTWQHPGAWVSGSALTHTEGDPTAPEGFTGCESLDFGPTIVASGSNPAAESPTGLDFELKIADPGLTEVGARADSDIEKVAVTLPPGFVTNPSVASGLAACSQAQYEQERIAFDPSSGCPQASKIGSVEVTSPLLAEKIAGQIYVAKQQENPFHSLLALYMILRSDQYGILIKQPMKIEPDPATGQLTTIVDQIPQLPFSNFHLHFRQGPRAPLMTPPTCGSFTTAADLYPYSNPGKLRHDTAALSVTGGANGAGCATSPSQVPHVPGFSAGTIDPRAASYSPFVLTLTRPDGSQQFSAISTTLPEGLIGKLAGIPYCPEAGIAQADSRGGEGQGAAEIASPSCPLASEIGTVTVASGAGPQPFHVTGHAYLAGPYKGAPLSLEIITPAIAGPFDLGVVAVRTALRVDLESSQITAVSDPIPTILHGLPLDVRSIAIDMSRPSFTLNPTSCAPKSIVGSVTSTLGATASLSQYFQASNCRSLKFKPKLKLSLKGATKRAGHPALKAVVTYPQQGAYANIARAQVGLPHSEFLDQGNIGTVCPQPQLKSATCPPKSIYGHAKAWTPLLDHPLEGPVYLGVGYGHKLPDLVADLNGQVRILLHGRVDTTKHNGIRNTFEAVPDAPVSRFVLEMKGGKKKGLLENSQDICRRKQRASARFNAQNGASLQLHPRVAIRCKAHKKKHRAHHKQHSAAHKNHGR